MTLGTTWSFRKPSTMKTYRINYEVSGEEHSPDWHFMLIEAPDWDSAEGKFNILGYHHYDVIIEEIENQTQ